MFLLTFCREDPIFLQNQGCEARKSENQMEQNFLGQYPRADLRSHIEKRKNIKPRQRHPMLLRRLVMQIIRALTAL